MQKKILIIYTSSGYGHKIIAENIAAVLRAEHLVDLLNLSELEKPIFDRGVSLYLWMLNKIPRLWKFFYTNQIFLDLTLPLRRIAAGFKFHKLLQVVAAKPYDLIICTEVNPSAIVSYLKTKGLFAGKFAVSFSDFHLHRYWLFDNVDLYLANISEQKDQMIKLGIPEHKIAVCGITLKPIANIDKAGVCGKYAVDFAKPKILIAGGGRGLGIKSFIISQFANLDIALLVVCGRNKQLYETFTKFYAGQKNIHILGFIENMQELYLISSLVLTKPGGLTIAECLQFDLPVIIIDHSLAHENLNFHYLAKRNLVMNSHPGGLNLVVQQELATGNFTRQLKDNPSKNSIVQNGEAVKLAVRSLLEGV